jgi:hypothetical protein
MKATRLEDDIGFAARTWAITQLVHLVSILVGLGFFYWGIRGLMRTMAMMVR